MGFFSYRQKRQSQMQETASKLGMEFKARDEYGLISLLKDFELFKNGHSKRITNMIYRKRDLEKPDIRVFDYRYVISAGNSHRVYKQTVFFIHSKELNLPQLLMKPETFFHRIAEFFGYEDIDFEAFPIFSKEYYLKGPDESLIRKTFDEQLLHYFTVNKNWSLEGLNYLLVFYQKGKRIPPDQIEEFYKKGLKLYEMLKEKEV